MLERHIRKPGLDVQVVEDLLRQQDAQPPIARRTLSVAFIALYGGFRFM
jgi:hypothetical protein